MSKLKFPCMMLLVLAGVTAFAADAPVAAVAAAAPAAPKVSQEMFTINNVWMMIAVFMVFIMNLGFAMIETGLTRAKNSVNILFKNMIIPALGLLTYALVGFSLMYPGTAWVRGKFLGFAGFGLNCPEGAAAAIDYAGGNYTYWTDFLYQGMFAATAATIVSGAVAERIKFSSFIIFSTVFVALVYPILGSWGWGKGWLDGIGFHDLAGSTFVHSIGGCGALAGVMLLGPRIGKYVNGKVKPIMGHNMPLATIGTFILWFGWYGFNGGSVFSADPMGVSYVFATTTLAACAGMVSAMLTSWAITKKPDLSMVLNGCLAGLVAITAGADCVSISASIIIGLIGGVLVVFAVGFFDKLQLDDPVGALSVHLVNGIWGTLAVGIFSAKYSFMSQLIGSAAVCITSFICAYVIFFVIKKTMGIRVSEEEESKGLDIGEHGMEAYGGFQIFSTQ